MAYLIDSDIIIYSIKQNEKVNDAFRQHTNIPKAISVITYGELLFGARKSQQVEKNSAVVSRIAEIFPIIDVSPAVMETFAHLKASMQRSGVIIPDLDLIIGATALTMNYRLVTNNEKHFMRIPGIELENWTR